MTQRSVLIVEDQTVFREMLAELLRMEPGYAVVGQLALGGETAAAVKRLRPDLVIVDVILPDITGLDVLRYLRANHPRIRVLVVTGQQRPEVVMDAFRAQAHGIVTKSASLAELRRAIRHVTAGGTYYCPTSSAVLRTYHNQPAAEVLSRREQQIVRLVALGQGSKQIAATLQIATKTVANHRQRISRKLKTADIAGLTRYAIAQGWIDNDT